MTDLEQELIARYLHAGFGKVLKAEIDALVFHHLALDRLSAMDAALVDAGTINYFRVNKAHIHALSLELRTTEPVITRLLEQDYVTHRAQSKTDEEASVAAILFDLIGATGIKKENIKEGKLRFYVANPIVQKTVQTEIYKLGGMVDCSFNKDILVIDMYDLLRLLRFSDDALLKREIKALLERKMDTAVTAGEEAFIAQLTAKPVQDQLKSILKGGVGKIAEKFLGEEGGADAINLVERFIDYAKTGGLR